MSEKKLILIVEDSLTQAENLKYILGSQGYQAEIASDGIQAMKWLENNKPDLVISDIIMPEMNGYELCKKIKSSEQLRKIPVILLSSLSHSSDVINGLVAGADNFLSKPFDEATLGKVIKAELLKAQAVETESELKEYSVKIDNKTHLLTANSEKVLSFLLSTYDMAILKNKALIDTQKELNELNQTLEQKVKKRTSDLANEVEERKKAHQGILEREWVIREITENVRNLVFKTDLEGIYLWVNPAHTLTLGYNQEDLIGRSIFEFIHPEDQEKVISMFRDRMKEGIQYSTEYKFHHVDGHFVWFECKANFLPGSNKETGSIVFTANEITERKDTEENLIRGKEKAEKSDLLKSSFLANMSHDIRTPMNSIIGFAELLKEKELSEKERTKFLDQITNNGESLLNLVNDIIDVSKIEAGALTIHETKCPINTICDELADYYTRYLDFKANKQITISCVKGLEDLNQLIITDPLRFRQIMSNLLSNAIKFTDHGGVEFGYALIDEQTLQFFVTDSGIGIPREDQDRIFDQFMRVESVMEQNQGGTGLGLTISRNLTTLLGGKMWVESQVDKGSTFYFTLPYKSAEEQFEAPELQPTITTLPDLSDKKILIVEDDFSSYSYLQAALCRLHPELVWVKDGITAVKSCKERDDIDLVLMDIQLPKLNGFEATPLIKEVRPDLPVIAQTAYTMSGEEQKCYQAGCDDYLAKPIKPNDLIYKVCKYLVNNKKS